MQPRILPLRGSDVGITILRVLVAFAVLALWVSTPARAEPPKLAVFDFELLDTSLEGEMRGPQTDERERLMGLS